MISFRNEKYLRMKKGKCENREQDIKGFHLSGSV